MHTHLHQRTLSCVYNLWALYFFGALLGAYAGKLNSMLTSIFGKHFLHFRKSFLFLHIFAAKFALFVLFLANLVYRRHFLCFSFIFYLFVCEWFDANYCGFSDVNDIYLANMTAHIMGIFR